MKTVNRNKGFTLVELIVVIAIVAILASVSIAGYSVFIKNARNSNAGNELNQVYRVIYTDASKPDELKDYHITTEAGKLSFVFENDDPENIKEELSGLLSLYLDAGFYEGEFVFSKDLLTYTSASGGIAKIEILFNYDFAVSITVLKDGELKADIEGL